MPENESPIILIVDDTPQAIEPIVNKLKKTGYRIMVATSGKKALPAMQKNKPDLILLDLMMPDEDGYAVYENIRKMKGYENIPIIFLTAKEEIEDEAKGFSIGAVDFIRKPVNPIIVQSRVDTHLGLKMAHDEIQKMNSKLYSISKTLNEKVKAQTIELTKSMNNTIKLLISTLEMRFQIMRGHSQRVTALAVELAAAAGLPKDVIDRVKVASLLHDVGILGIPEAETTQKGVFKLDARHCEIGNEMVHFIGDDFKSVAEIILYHHEHMDGSGMLGVYENLISIESRIISLADTFDTIIYGIGKDKASYIKEYAKDIEVKDAANEDELVRQAAIVHIKKNGFTCYDSTLVKVFLDLMKSKGVSSKNEGIVPIDKLKPGMRLARILQSKSGVILLPFGTMLTSEHIEKIKTLSMRNDAPGDIYIIGSNL